MDIKRYLEKKVKIGKPRPKLKDIDPSIPAGAWLVLRW